MKKNSEQVFMLGKALGLELNWNQLHFTLGALILNKAHRLCLYPKLPDCMSQKLRHLHQL